jgi:hypothetical protein
MYEVLSHGAEEEAEPGGGEWRWHGLNRFAIGCIVLALTAGLVGGAAGARAAHRHHAPVVPPVRLDAIVLVPAGGDVTPSILAGGTVTDVDLAVINEGDQPVDSVVAQWASLDQTEVGARPLLEPVGRLSPGAPETVQLHLFRSCSGSPTAPVPSVLLTWSRGRVPQRMVVQPYGLDRLWTQLPAACPTSGVGPVSALDLHVDNAVLHGTSLRLTMHFVNQDEVPLAISELTITGGFTQVSHVSPSFVVGGHSGAQASLTVRVRDCREAIQRSYTAGLSYRVGSKGATTITPTFMDGALSGALGTLFYKMCAHS